MVVSHRGTEARGHGGAGKQRRGEVLKFGSSKVLKFELAPVPNHPQVINRQDAKHAKGSREWTPMDGVV